MPQNLLPFRRRPLRFLLKKLSIPAFALLTRMEIIGAENLPKEGPLLVAGNHFSFIDPVAFVRMAPWPIEFVGGAENPHAPAWTRLIPFLWGYHKLYRGTGARDALRAGEKILQNGGFLGISPEGGNWATVLRPARPGITFLATRSGARILPVGLYGFTEVFPALPIEIAQYMSPLMLVWKIPIRTVHQKAWIRNDWRRIARTTKRRMAPSTFRSTAKVNGSQY